MFLFEFSVSVPDRTSVEPALARVEGSQCERIQTADSCSMASESEGNFTTKEPVEVAIFLKAHGISDDICEKFEGEAYLSWSTVVGLS